MKAGAKPVALFLHGFLGQPDDWDQVVKHIPALHDWEVCCFNLWEDLPLLDFTSMPAWIDALAAKCHSISPLFLCGYSLGARLAMVLACRHPDLVARLAVISGHPGLLSESEKSSRVLDDSRWGEIFLKKPWNEAIELWNQRDVFAGHEISPAAGSLVASKLQRGLEIFSLGKQPDLRPCLQQLQMPVLWVVGKDDSKFARLAQEKWITDSSIAVREIPDCGHRVLHEKPRELAAFLNAFLSDGHSKGGDA